ncbi:MAG: hypothetical protein BroJett040_02720 [Oligoflexia bacterium]|nr:MAG: hypothetical protein BroJett040_02720 [Oligoflexia bacterium]
MNKGRRQFLSNTLSQSISLLGAGSLLSSGLLTTSCSQLDRIIVGDGADETRRVLILGGGAAGLAAGYHLRKNDIPFRIFEASSRVGGRVLTIHDFNSSGQVAELGAEWFRQQHDLVLKYCKEFRLDTDDVNDYAKEFRFFHSGIWIRSADFVPEIKKLQNYIYQRQAQKTQEEWDLLSLEDFLFELKKVFSPWVIAFIRRTVQQEWGTDPTHISTLAWMKSFPFQTSQKLIKIQAGSGALIEAMYRRLAGVIPDSTVVFRHELIRIKNKGNYFELRFSTPKGNFDIKAQVIICTLPFSVLRGIEGIDQIGLSGQKLKCIQNLGYGTQTKIGLSYPQRFWKSFAEPFALSGDFDTQSIRESSVQKASLNALKGVLSVQIGGHLGYEGGEHLVDLVKKDLERMKVGVVMPPEAVQIHNWARNRYALGSQSYYRVGQYLSLKDVLASSEFEGRLIFAGEHTSARHRGTLNGAFESGVRAAAQAIAARAAWMKQN